MIGDRYLIDTVFGNKHGMLTIHPDPITSHGEPKAVCAVSMKLPVSVTGPPGLHIVPLAPICKLVAAEA